MIFWILLAAILGLAIWALVWNILDRAVSSGIGAFLAIVVFGPIVAVILLAIIGSAFPLQEVSRTQLQAIAVASSTEGHFFLGSGYVDGKRVLNYITAQDGYSEIEQADASRSRIYEDTDDPYVTRLAPTADAWWFAPFTLHAGMGNRYDFHIPSGSILENYTIDNQ